MFSLTICARTCLLALCLAGAVLLPQCDSDSSEDGYIDAAKVPDALNSSQGETDSSTAQKCLGPERWISISGPCEALAIEECSAKEPVCHPVFGEALASDCVQPSIYAG